MARPLRSDRQFGWHHVVNRGIDRTDVFHTDADRLDFGRLISAAAERYEVDVLAYCLMTNHYHLVLSCPAGGLSSFMQDVSAKYTRHVNQRQGGDGPLFRGRFASREILSERYLVNAVRYVHRNALALPDVSSLAAYRWSSHRTYMGLRPSPTWLSTQPVLGWFESAAAFDEFVMAASTSVPHDCADAAAVVSAIDFVVAAEADRLGRTPQGVARTLGYLILDDLPASSAAGLLAHLAPASDDASKQAVWRAKRAAQAEPVYLDLLEEIYELASGTFTRCLTQRESQSQAGRLAS